MSLEEKVNSIVKRPGIRSYMVPQTPNKFARDLAEGYIILLGASKDPGMGSCEGFSRGWYLESILSEVKTLLQKDLFVYKIPHGNNRDIVLVALQNRKEEVIREYIEGALC